MATIWVGSILEAYLLIAGLFAAGQTAPGAGADAHAAGVTHRNGETTSRLRQRRPGLNLTLSMDRRM
jgi:hypothetical protein